MWAYLWEMHGRKMVIVLYPIGMNCQLLQYGSGGHGSANPLIVDLTFHLAELASTTFKSVQVC